MICRLCLQDSYTSSTPLIEIFGDHGKELNIAAVIAKHFWFEPTIDDPISTSLCNSCWIQVWNFHEFYSSVEKAMYQFTQTAQAKFIKNEPMDESEENNVENIAIAAEPLKNQQNISPAEEIFIVKNEVSLDDDAMRLPSENTKDTNDTSHSTSISRDIQLLKEEVKESKSILQMLLAEQSANNVLLVQLIERKKHHYKFPINTEEDLEKMEATFAAKKEEYTAIISKILEGDLNKNLEKVVATKLLIEYNYDGLKAKKPFKRFKSLNNILFDCLQVEGFTEKDYEHNIKMAFKLMKNRFNKQQSIKSKKQKTNLLYNCLNKV